MISARAARERTFLSSMAQAMDGERVLVASPCEQLSIIEFERYVRWIGASTTVESISKTGRVVTFHGGGSVRFIVLGKSDMDGRQAQAVLIDDMEEHE